MSDVMKDDKEKIEVKIEKTIPKADDETKNVIRKLMELQRELKRSIESLGSGSFSTTLPDSDSSGVRKLEPKSKIRDPLDVASEILNETQVVFPSSSPHPALARAYNDLGYVYKIKGEFQNSVEAYHKSIQLYEESLGRRSRGYATVMRNTSTCYKDWAFSVGTEADAEGSGSGESRADIEMEKMGLLSRAREAGEEALKWSEEWEKMVGDNMDKGVEGDDDEEGHKFTEMDLLGARKDRIGAAFSLAAVLTAQSRALSASKQYKTKKTVKQKSSIAGKILKKAETTCRAAIQEMSSMEGIEYIDLLMEGSKPSLQLANGLNTLGVILSLRGSKHTRDKSDAMRFYSEAESFYMKAYEIRSKTLKRGHEDVVASLFNLGEVADRMGREEDANKIREYLMQEVESVVPDTTPGGTKLNETEEERQRRELDETLASFVKDREGLGGGEPGRDTKPGTNFT